MKNTLKLTALYFGLGISSLFSMDLPRYTYTAEPQQIQVAWDTFQVPNSFIHGTFQGGIIKLYHGNILFREYDTRLLNQSMPHTKENGEHNRFKTIISVLYDSKINTIYIQGDSLCGNDYPLLEITRTKVTELFKEAIVARIYRDKQGNVHAWTVQPMGSGIMSGFMSDIQLNNQKIRQQQHLYNAWQLFSNQPQRPKL